MLWPSAAAFEEGHPAYLQGVVDGPDGQHVVMRASGRNGLTHYSVPAREVISVAPGVLWSGDGPDVRASEGSDGWRPNGRDHHENKVLLARGSEKKWIDLERMLALNPELGLRPIDPKTSEQAARTAEPGRPKLLMLDDQNRDHPSGFRGTERTASGEAGDLARRLGKDLQWLEETFGRRGVDGRGASLWVKFDARELAGNAMADDSSDKHEVRFGKGALGAAPLWRAPDVRMHELTHLMLLADVPGGSVPGLDERSLLQTRASHEGLADALGGVYRESWLHGGIAWSPRYPTQLAVLPSRSSDHALRFPALALGLPQRLPTTVTELDALVAARAGQRGRGIDGVVDSHDAASVVSHPIAMVQKQVGWRPTAQLLGATIGVLGEHPDEPLVFARVGEALAQAIDHGGIIAKGQRHGAMQALRAAGLLARG